MWNSSTYRLEKTLNYGLERVWCAAYLKVYPQYIFATTLFSFVSNAQGSNVLALGYDEGTVVIKLGRSRRYHFAYSPLFVECLLLLFLFPFFFVVIHLLVKEFLLVCNFLKIIIKSCFSFNGQLWQGLDSK